MKKTVRCPQCGTMIQAGADVCPACGFELKTYRDTNRTKSSLPAAVLLFILIALLLVIAWGIRRLPAHFAEYWLHRLETQLAEKGEGNELPWLKPPVPEKKRPSYKETLEAHSSDLLTITDTGWVRYGELLLVYARVVNTDESAVAVWPHIVVTAYSGEKSIGTCTLGGWTIPPGEERLLTGNIFDSSRIVPDSVVFEAQEGCRMEEPDPSWKPLAVESGAFTEEGLTVTVRNDNGKPVRFASISLLVTDEDGSPVWLTEHPLYEEVPANGTSSWTFHLPYKMDFSGCQFEVSADGDFPTDSPLWEDSTN